MKRISIVVAAVVLISSIFFLAAAPAPSAMRDDYVQVVGVVKYNDFGSHFKTWNGIAYGGTVYLKHNGVTVGSCAIGNGGVYSITSNLDDDQDYDLVLTTTVLSNGSGIWQGTTSYHHVEEVMEDVTIFSLNIQE